MKLIDMKKSDAKQGYEASMPAAFEKGEEYPYGLKVCLGEDELQKLGIEELPEVNASMMLHAEAKVCLVESNKSLYGHHRRLELQITRLSVMGGEGDADGSEKSYES